MYVLEGAVALLAVVLFVSYLRRRSARRQDREREYQKMASWASSVEAATSDKVLAAIDPPSEAWSGERVKVAATKRMTAINSIKEEAACRRAAADEAAAEEELAGIWMRKGNECCDLLVRFVYRRLPRDCWESFEDERKRFIEQRADRLYAAARDGSFDAFAQLRLLVELDAFGYTSTYKRALGMGYVFPADWDELLVRYYKMPAMSEFRNQVDPSSAGMQLLAPRALAEQDLLMAEWVLAATRGDDPVSQARRRAIGDVMLYELLEFVHHRSLILQNAREESA